MSPATRTDVTGRIIQATFEMGRMMRTKMMCGTPNDMHMGQLHALVFIQEKDGITMSELAEMLHIKSPTATAFIDRLVKLGYVSRNHNNDNRKLVHLSLTELGASVLKEKFAEKKKIVERMLCMLSDEDKTEFLRIIEKILAHSSSL